METSQEIIVRSLDRAEIDIAPSAIGRRDAAILRSKTISEVENEFDQALAVDSAAELASLEKQMEQSRKLVKAPILELGKLVDLTAQNFIEPVLQEKTRLLGLIEKRQEAIRQEILKNPGSAEKNTPGLGTSRPIKVEILDPLAFFDKHPKLCEIQVRVAALKRHIKKTGETEFPGVKVSFLTKASVRANKVEEIGSI